MTATEVPPATPPGGDQVSPGGQQKPPREPQARARVRRGPVLSPRAGAALAVVVVVVMVLALPVKTYINQRSRISQLESELAGHNQRVAELTAQHKRWKDPAYLEAQARARLHFVRVGQVGYVVLTDAESKVKDTTTARPQAKVPSTGPWWSALWSTVEQASTPKSQQPVLAPEPAKAAPSYGGTG